MKNESLILGELREFKRAAIERFDSLEQQVAFLQKAEYMRMGKNLAFTLIGSVLGAGLTIITAYLWS